jgi:hypothetical protein
MANYPRTCDVMDSPPGYVHVNIVLPEGSQKVGDYALGPNDPAPHVVAAVYAKDPPSQKSKEIAEGMLYLNTATASELAGSIQVSDPDVVLSGTFSATICPPP